MKPRNWMFPIFVLMALFVFVPNTGWGSSTVDPENPESTVKAYFEYLKQGNIDKIIPLLHGKLRKEKQELIGNGNAQYSAFLADYYRDAVLVSVKLGEIEEERIRCRLEFRQNEELIVFELILTRIGNTWRITDELI